MTETTLPGVHLHDRRLRGFDPKDYETKRTRCAGCGIRLPTCFLSDHATGCSGNAGTIEVSDRQLDAAMMAAKLAASTQGSAP